MSLELDLEDERFALQMQQTVICRECRLAPPDYTRAVSFGTYTGELRELMQMMKFSRVRALAPRLGAHLASAILKLEGQAGAELLVIAVPLFAARERQRGFNQSVLLAAEALRLLRKSRPAWKLTAAHSALERQRSTESSFGLSRRGRRRNMAGAFRVAGDVRGREVLLVDDILTSGATARECARVLRRAGAAQVWVATVARSQKGIVRANFESATATWSLAQQ